MSTGAVSRVRDRVAGSRRAFAITGAGISAESGIPTFRTAEGLWSRFDPNEYATHEAFTRDPDKVWRWRDRRRQEMAVAAPNPAHFALARLAREARRVLVVTQNVDDLHERAGSTEVVHIHGSVWMTRCARDGTIDENREIPLSEILPRCGCGRPMRPGVVWFGERLPIEAIQRYLLDGPIDVCLIVGTEATFGYVIEWAPNARDHGALLVDVNPRVTGPSPLVDVHLPGRAGEILPQLIPPKAHA